MLELGLMPVVTTMGSATQCQDEEDEEQQQHQYHPTNHLAVQHNVNKKNNNTKDNKPPANQEYIT